MPLTYGLESQAAGAPTQHGPEFSGLSTYYKAIKLTLWTVLGTMAKMLLQVARSVCGEISAIGMGILLLVGQIMI